MSPPHAGDGELLQSLVRGLAVLRAFDADRAVMSLAEVSRATGLAPASARRVLMTLEHLGYVGSDGRTFSLRPRVLELGLGYLSSLGLPQLARPHLADLAGRVAASTSVSVLDGTEIVYVARHPVRRVVSVSISVGTRFPAHATSMGRVLLAGLPEAERAARLRAVPPVALTSRTTTDVPALLAELGRVAAQGWSLVDQELEEGLRSVAAPVTRDGRVVAALNIAVPVTGQSPGEVAEQLRAPLLATAGALSGELDVIGWHLP